MVRKHIVAGLLGAATLATAGHAMAGTITYNFNTDGSLADSNGQNTLIPAIDSNNYITVSGGVATLSSDGTNGGAYTGATLTTPFSISGDFTASVDVDLINGGNDEFLVFRATGINNAEVYFGFNPGNNRVQAAGPNGGYNELGGNSPGTFTLSRTNNSVTGTYSTVGGGVINTETFTGAEFAADTPLILNIQLPAGYATAPASATFDNFTITAGNVGDVATPEPASLGLLAIGGLALLRRRRKGSN